MVDYKDIKVGNEIPSVTKIAYQRALDEVAFREDSSHKKEYAMSKGYTSALLSGYILCGYLSEFLVNFFGPNWLKGGEVSLSFNKAVHQGDKVTIRGTVVERTDEKNGTRVTVDFWMEKGDGTKVVDGNASGVLSA